MPALHVTSEVGPLEAVLVHAPGSELKAITPANREDYLYDDIIDPESAAREHSQFAAVLERFARVYQARRVLRDVFEQPEAREFLISKTLDVVPSEVLGQKLAELPSDDLVTMIIEGTEEESGPVSRALNEVGYALPALPNLFFPRDNGVVIGDHAVVCSMRYGIRWTEELLVKALFRYHPDMRHAGILYDGSEERRNNYTLEGGDVHVLRHDLLLLGFSERTSPAAIDHLCDVAFANTAVTDVLVMVMPKMPTAIHLDMIFTQIDRELCLVHPPYFLGPERRAVLHRRKGVDTVREMPDFFAALREVQHPLEPVFVGGGHRTTQDREQWSSGCNSLAVRPGVIITYRRNEATLRELERFGFRVIPSADFLTTPGSTETDGRTVITIQGAELARGGGGPRCMTMALRRGEP